MNTNTTPLKSISKISRADTDTIERVRRELAVGLYSQGVLWLDEASKLAYMHCRDFQQLLKQKGIALRSEDVSMLEYLLCA
jgi:predicted HTH domain antitoxin